MDLPNDVEEALWYFGELVEAVETVAKRKGYDLPVCFHYAKAAWTNYFVQAARRDEA